MEKKLQLWSMYYMLSAVIGLLHIYLCRINTFTPPITQKIINIMPILHLSETEKG